MFWGQSSWAGGGYLGKIDQFTKLFYFSANLQNEIKSFDQSIDHPIVEVLMGGFCLNHKIRAAGPGKRLHHGCVLCSILFIVELCWGYVISVGHVHRRSFFT